MIDIRWREWELEQWKKRHLQEKELLKRLKAGLMDGLIGEGFEDVDLTSQAMIKDGRPMLVKYLTEKGPVEDATIIEKEFLTDEGKLWFLRNYGWKMEDVHAQLYSRMFKRAGSP